jgi:hypothetical protein
MRAQIEPLASGATDRVIERYRRLFPGESCCPGSTPMNDLPAAIDSVHVSSKEGARMSDEDLKAELERLRGENAALKKGASTGVRMKVSEKGAVSIYGMGRFPVTLYKEQWLKLLDMSDDIRTFIAANEAQLKAKD